jgi:hypothetical protein
MRSIILILSIPMILIAGSVAAGDRDVILRVETGLNAWTHNGFEGALVTRMTRDPNLRVVAVPQDSKAHPPFPKSSLDIDSLITWGQEIGGRYLLSFVVESQRIDRRKSFHVPLIFHKWETVGVIEGEYRLLDLQRARLLSADRFKSELPAKRVFQATMDDNKYDPDIHLRPDEKAQLFARLYDECARELLDKLSPKLGGR